LDIILADYKKHRAVAETTHNEELLEPVEKFTDIQLQGKEVIEQTDKDGNSKKYVRSMVQKK